MGSTLEARRALEELTSRAWPGELYHLPVPPSAGQRFLVTGTPIEGVGGCPKRARLLDVWGKSVLSLALESSMGMLDTGAAPVLSGVRSLPVGLTVRRTSPSEDGFLVSLSDGSDLLCAAVLFADGSDTQARLFWDKPAVVGGRGTSLRCWAFESDNLISIKDWEFRWAQAKSIELLPLPEQRLAVKLRFKSNFGGSLSKGELSELFSEFGSDMTALFEGLSADDLCCREESTPEGSVFCPAAGCMSLGRAAWSPTPFLTFDWLDRFVSAQLETVLAQAHNPTLSFESFEAQSKERMSDLFKTSEFVSGQLHLDNSLLRPLRNALLAVVPSVFWGPRLRRKLFT